MKKPLAIVLGCGCLAVAAAAALFFAFVIWGVRSVQTPKEVDIEVSAPAEVDPGEAFEIRIRVTDTSGSKRLLDSIDVADELLPGFDIRSTDPPYRGKIHIPGDNTQSYDLQMEVPASGTTAVVFHAVATRSGTWSGDLDVCVDGVASYVPKPVRIRVR